MSQQDFLAGSVSDVQQKTDESVDSNRFSLNLDDFEKVDADQLQSSAFPSTLADPVTVGAKETTSAVQFGMDDTKHDFSNFGVSGTIMETSDNDQLVVGITGAIDESVSSIPQDVKLDTFSSLKSDFSVPNPELETSDKIHENMNIIDDFSTASNVVKPETDAIADLLSSVPKPDPVANFSLQSETSERPSIQLDDPFHNDNINVKDDYMVEEPIVKDQFRADDLSSEVNPSPSFNMSDHPSSDLLSQMQPSDSMKDHEYETEQSKHAVQRDMTPSPRELTPSPREPTPPPRQPTPPPREPTPPPRQPTPPPREPTPPPREPTPPPRKPTPPPRQPTPPPREPTPPPREPTPPPRQPTPPPREPTPPPRQPTPPPREPTPPPRQPTPPPREPTPPPREPTPPPKEIFMAKSATKSSTSVESAKPKTSVQKVYPPMDSSTSAALAVFDPLAKLIYWRDLKKSGGVLGGLLVLLLSLTVFSLISVLAYTALTVLFGAVTFRIYKNVKQAVQKTQDGHPFKEYLAVNPALPSDNVHSAVDVMLGQINSTLAYLHRIFLVEDLIDSCKFGCYLWVLTYIGAWVNGLTLIILAVIALFSLPKAYEQNKAQVDQYMGLAQQQVNQVLEKVKAVIPMGGNKDKEQ